MDFKAFHEASTAPFCNYESNCLTAALAAFPDSDVADKARLWWQSLSEDLRIRYATLPNQVLIWHRVFNELCAAPSRASGTPGIGLAGLGLHLYCITDGRLWFARTQRGVCRLPARLIIRECGV
jgi:hypothetical protein